MPEEDNASLVAKFLDELWNKQNVDIIDQLTVEDYIVHIPQGDLGREALKKVAKFYFGRFSLIRICVLKQNDLPCGWPVEAEARLHMGAQIGIIHLSIVDQTSQDSQVVTRIQWDTVLKLGNQSLNQEIERKIPARGVSIDRIDHGRIAESWNMLDTLYWLFNIQELSRNPVFVQVLPGLQPCPPDGCPPLFTCEPPDSDPQYCVGP